MNPDRRRNRHRAPSCGVHFLFLCPQRNCQVRPFPPEGTFRLMQEHGFRRIRHRIQSGLPQDVPRKSRTIHKKKCSDLPGIRQCMRTVTDHLQCPGGEGRDRRNMGRLYRILRGISRRSFHRSRIRRHGIIDHIRIPGRPWRVLRLLIRFPDQDRCLSGEGRIFDDRQWRIIRRR